MADNQEDENLTQEEIEEADQAEQEAFEEEQLLNKQRYENNIRSRFNAMKRIYMTKSKFWPILGFRSGWGNIFLKSCGTKAWRICGKN